VAIGRADPPQSPVAGALAITLARKLVVP
jgi:hypothetical protein